MEPRPPEKKVLKRYIDTDVYTESKKRLRHILDIFDSIAVCFSGGKDSLVTLQLFKEVLQEEGIPGPSMSFSAMRN